MFHFFLPQSIWDLSLTIRDQNLSRCIEGKTLTTDVPIPVFLPGESHGQRSLAAYSP